MRKELKSESRYLNEVSDFFFIGKGKMLRPILTLLCGEENNKYDLLIASAAFEILHMASLVHDDIIDQSKIRRSNKTINEKYSICEALLLGDFYYIKAIDLFSRINKPIMKYVINTIVKLIEGEMDERDYLFDFSIDESKYLNMIYKKTGSLISACCTVGAIIGDQNDKKVYKYKKYGEYLGIAYQLRDDLYDYSENIQVIGKDIGQDLKNGIITLPIIHLFQGDYLKESEKKTFKNLIKEGMLDEDVLKSLKLKMLETGSFEYTKEKILFYGNSAYSELEELEDCEYIKELKAITKYIIKNNDVYK
ncbi:polyprenyl synthetase family protein [Thermohalobacter berrensis]|uniref:Polyprenyl synthetase n=1 Tax=Thermohalobacter berrensis TaxID=99594 RepID=A0A419T8U9_9FIRM|nr:polyprenyl synthetase family protein [Thermohalobacter berrensis]RKD33905.1 hypothetical protein BET03_08230 [Thermohalobacter berrensis]